MILKGALQFMIKSYIKAAILVPGTTALAESHPTQLFKAVYDLMTPKSKLANDFSLAASGDVFARLFGDKISLILFNLGGQAESRSCTWGVRRSGCSCCYGDPDGLCCPGFVDHARKKDRSLELKLLMACRLRDALSRPLQVVSYWSFPLKTVIGRRCPL